MATVVFTPDEQRLIANAINYGLFNQPSSWEQFQRHGVIGGIGEVAKSVITSPFHAAGTVISERGGLGDRPLQTLTGLAAFVPVGRLGTALAGTGARAAGRNCRNGNKTNLALYAKLKPQLKDLFDIIR